MTTRRKIFLPKANKKENFEMKNVVLYGDCRELLSGLPDGIFDSCVTSPPYYGLRDYGCEGQIGQEDSPEEFVEGLVSVFREVRRTLKDTGTLWLNIGDSYARGFGGGSPGGKSKTNHGSFSGRKPGKKPKGLNGKDLIGIPWMLAFALRSDGWILRQEIIWNKTNSMPESVRDRFTKSHETVFLLSKSKKYFFDVEASMEASGGELVRRRSVLSIPNKPFKGAHFATFPEALASTCIIAGTPEGGCVLDPFGGSGTTAISAKRCGRDYVLMELNGEYAEMSRDRIMNEG